MYYRKANAAMLVYDITNPESFDDLRGWVHGESFLSICKILKRKGKLLFIKFGQLDSIETVLRFSSLDQLTFLSCTVIIRIMMFSELKKNVDNKMGEYQTLNKGSYEHIETLRICVYVKLFSTVDLGHSLPCHDIVFLQSYVFWVTNVI